MRTKLIMLGIISLSLGACTSSRMQSGVAYNDDIYYNPKAKPLSVSDQFAPVLTDKAVQKEDQQVYSQKAREYARTADDNDPRDFSQIQTQYANILADEQLTDVDTMVYFNDETGYWVNGFSGSSYDQDYAERLAKFHGPFRGIPYWSPLYTQVVYFSGPDWNVYLDGDYAYVFPSWSNRFYSNFYYGGYRPYWNMSFGFGYPYYGWYDSWYNPYFGFGGYYPYWGYDPYWHGSHYWPHHHHRPGGNIAGNQNSPSRYYGSRTGNNNTAVGNINSSTSYRSSTTRYSSYAPSTGNREMTVTRDGNPVSTRGNVTYTRPGTTVNGTTNKGTSSVVGSSGTNNAVRNSSATRGSSQRSGTTVTNRYSSGNRNSSATGSSSRPTYQPGSATRSTTVERNVNNNTIRSGSSTPSSNSSTYTPSRSGSSSSGSSGRTNRR